MPHWTGLPCGQAHPAVSCVEYERRLDRVEACGGDFFRVPANRAAEEPAPYVCAGPPILNVRKRT